MEKEEIIPGRALKHYESYKRTIAFYAKAVRIKIERSPYDCDGAYVPHRRVVRVDPELTESHEIAVLLHEFGHSLDDAFMATAVEGPVNLAYGAIYKNKATKKQKKIVLQCEIRAWNSGRILAKKLKIPLGKWYDKSMKYCLKGYKVT